MKKKKFEQKCQELIDYEEAVLKSVRTKIGSLDFDLKSRDLEMTVDLIWNYFGQSEYPKKRIPFEIGYTALVFCAIHKKGQNPHDDKVECFDRVYPFTAIHKNIFYCTIFEKRGIEEGFYSSIQDGYDKIVQIGYDNYIEELKKEE